MYRYTPEQAAFLRANAAGTLVKDLVEMFNKQFETNLSYDQIRCYMSRHKIKNRMAGKQARKKIFTPEQEAFIRANAKKQFGLGLQPNI